MGRLAITGITGKSGQFFWQEIKKQESLIRQLYGDGINLISRDLNKLEEFKLAEITVTGFSGDLTDEQQNKDFCTGCDTLVHIAGIHWSLPLVKAAVECGIKRMILVHTTGIYSKYKAAGEEYRNIDSEIYEIAKKNNIALTILRPTMIYGDIKDNNVVVFIKMVDKLRIIPTVNGAHYELQPVHCADLGKAYFDVLISPEKCNNKDFVLSGGKPIELKEMFNEIAKNLGVKRSFVSCPFFIAYTGAWIMYILTFGKKDYREKVQRLVEPRVYSHDDAKQIFGYNPRTFQEGIVSEVKQYIEFKENR